jgi:nucleotide-binding universal stress UspA family protein
MALFARDSSPWPVAAPGATTAWMRRIVLGMDGSDGALEALRWATHEAELHQASLTAVYAWRPLGEPGTPSSFGDHEQAAALLRTWVDAVPTTTPTEVCVLPDLPTSALVDASAMADLVVLGSRGLGGFKELLLGSVSSVVAERALCPVGIVRTTTAHPMGAVVVGVDGSVQSAKALQWAATEARVRDVPLEVVHAWSGAAAPLPGLGVPSVMPLDHPDVAAEHRLTDAMMAVDLGGVAIHRRVVHGTPAGELVRLTSTAAVVVVGSRGRGGLTSVLLGSTSRHLLHHAYCPVVIVR